MSSLRSLRGGCHCGRNRYTINLPEDGAQIARVLFDTDPQHRFFQAGPLAAFIRVPLAWYRSGVSPLFPDEEGAQIHKTYTPRPTRQQQQRQQQQQRAHAANAAAAAAEQQHRFCGFCGTSLSYWSEDPPGEADFIRLALGSLRGEDLCDLEELGLVPGASDQEEDEDEGGKEKQQEQEGAGEGLPAARATLGAIPWFDSMVAGSRLGSLRASRAAGRSRDGRVRYEWEVVEWTAEDDDQGEAEAEKEVGGLDNIKSDGAGHPNPSKRLKQDDAAE